MLRHIFATNCISRGFDMKTLSELLGHSNITTTMRIYVHSDMERKKQLMAGDVYKRQVTDISKIAISGASRDRLYYVLQPAQDKEGRIFTPVDGQKTEMRRILNRKEAAELIDSIPSIGNLWVADERQRELNYKQAVNSCDCREWIKIIKTLWFRNQQRLSQGKKITAMDRKYFKMAEDNLYGELSVSLEIPKEKMEEYITEKVGMQMQEDAESFMEYSIE